MDTVLDETSHSEAPSLVSLDYLARGKCMLMSLQLLQMKGKESISPMDVCLRIVSREAVRQSAIVLINGIGLVSGNLNLIVSNLDIHSNRP